MLSLSHGNGIPKPLSLSKLRILPCGSEHPSGRFDVNSNHFQLAMLAYNLNCWLSVILAFAIAASLGLPLVVAKLDGLVSSFLGTTARNIGNLFDFANRYRCILLLDEFDALAKVRDDPQEVGEIKRVVNTLLQNLDSRPYGLTIAITNHPDLLDTAVWRRFEIRIEVPAPTPEDRIHIFERYLPPLEFDDATLKLLAWATEGLTGADIEVLTRNIKRYSALRAGEKLDYLVALRAYVLMQAGKGNENRRSLVLGKPQDLAKALSQDVALGFTQQGLPALFERDQATISRWLRNDAPTIQEVGG
jgi:SpoVK/Ycf46/Vps4 family AAA+-type ATPase